ncbi:PREDICTED: structural maintenance of chromosomes protein 6B-like [Ipomoea nil]|uniref:structural maintenance of chromosomes protein 6B-like n=1 Tax=Ipomoea nil TaxID=35883 RepID=UPI000900EBA1|nr:PREDICTED: structural maintenance of chromosomes protein 6B-like [Ipomoea nil]
MANQAGTISKIRLENFMCHNNLEIDFGDSVNFITGQNGSGKSAILTALCLAFGSRARGTQRANTMKDFIKTGCSYALVHVEIKNQGEDSFKPETYGRTIIVERRISESASSIILKNHQGKKVATRREDLHELVEHFNIDVENPCVIMSQDKSREFLHSGNDKDKFKFFFKATLLQQVEDLLKGIEGHLCNADSLIDELEKSISPIVMEIEELNIKIKSVEHIEEISHQLELLKKKLAWSWVYNVDTQLREKSELIVKLNGRIPMCQSQIDQWMRRIEELSDRIAKKNAQVAVLLEKTSEFMIKKDDFKQKLSLATKAKLGVEEEHGRKANYIQTLEKRRKLLDRQIHETQEQHIRNTQAEEHEMEERLKELQEDVDNACLILQRLRAEEDALEVNIGKTKDQVNAIIGEIQENEKELYRIHRHIGDLQLNRTSKVTAFGGSRVTHLLKEIERNHKRFKRSPIGPIGSHVTLVNGEKWGAAVENALGRLLNAFIVTDHKDSLVLRACAKDANYGSLQIIIYDFSRPRLNIPSHMLPQTGHPTTISVIRSEEDAVFNVLIDMGNAERQVLVDNYGDGKVVAFEQAIANLKEVYTSDGYKMFSRGSVQTTLPPMKNARTGRLCGSFVNQIESLERDALIVKERNEKSKVLKRGYDEDLRILNEKKPNTKRMRSEADRDLQSKEFRLKDFKKSRFAETCTTITSNDELLQEKSKIVNEIQEEEKLLEEIQSRLNKAEVKRNNLKMSLENWCESANKGKVALGNAEDELKDIVEDLGNAKSKKNYYEGVMNSKVLNVLKEVEKEYQELEHSREESYRKASIICSESEIDSLGGCSGSTPEQVSAQLTRLSNRLQQESRRHPESIDDLRVLYENKKRKIFKKQQTYKAFRDKLAACRKALDLRWNKFQRNASLLKRQLTWQFNGHLGKKGISGKIIVDYEKKTLSIEVTMPQDASSISVQDTRGLSGGERSFSTLCFALALHEMIEAPFRAMDEFDVFMDAVSRKISLDALVDFALAQGSQWIFITPHDISMVKQDERVRKQQMAAPRA